MHQSVIEFWFQENGPDQWFKKDPDFDQEIIRRFSKLHVQAAKGELFSWRKTPQGTLAEILLLDQFSRNMFRDTPQAFAFDNIALCLAQAALSKGCNKQLSKEEQLFLFMPYMHSESALIHLEAVKLFTQLGIENALDFEYQHKEIIDRFGRYPHRNETLGRHSTPEEIEFLTQEGSSF